MYICNSLCINRYFDKYNCDDAVNSYLRHCIEKFEGMSDVQEIAAVMHSFVDRYFEYTYMGVFVCIYRRIQNSIDTVKCMCPYNMCILL